MLKFSGLGQCSPKNAESPGKLERALIVHEGPTQAGPLKSRDSIEPVFESGAVEGAAGAAVRNNKGTLCESDKAGVSASTVRVRKNWEPSMIFAF
jgi:hypothetical protein